MKCDKTVRRIISRCRSRMGKKNGVISYLFDDPFLEAHMANNKRINKRVTIHAHQADLYCLVCMYCNPFIDSLIICHMRFKKGVIKKPRDNSILFTHSASATANDSSNGFITFHRLTHTAMVHHKGSLHLLCHQAN